MTYSEVLTLIGDLTNDPNSDRYTTAQRAIELDATQNRWNAEAKLITDTITVTTVDGTRQYALSGLTGTPISFIRVTHKGIELQKKDKAWLDQFAGGDWTADIGTPKYYVIEATDPDDQKITLYPIPQSGDAGANLVVFYCKAHTAMSATTDVPFMSGTSSNTLLRPFDYGVCYETAGRLLARDPSDVNVPKSVAFTKIGNNVLANVIQVFKGLEKMEPLQLRGGRYWTTGNVQTRK